MYAKGGGCLSSKEPEQQRRTDAHKHALYGNVETRLLWGGSCLCTIKINTAKGRRRCSGNIVPGSEDDFHGRRRRGARERRRPGRAGSRHGQAGRHVTGPGEAGIREAWPARGHPGSSSSPRRRKGDWLAQPPCSSEGVAFAQRKRNEASSTHAEPQYRSYF